MQNPCSSAFSARCPSGSACLSMEGLPVGRSLKEAHAQTLSVALEVDLTEKASSGNAHGVVAPLGDRGERQQGGGGEKVLDVSAGHVRQLAERIADLSGRGRFGFHA